MKHLKIKINELQFGDETILKNVDLVINENDKLSVVGPNGAGKSSLMKVILGMNKNFDGFIENVGNLKLGYLSQIFTDDENKTVWQELSDAFTKIHEIEKELSVYESKMADLDNSEPDIIEKYSDLIEVFTNIGGYEYENKIHQVASGIGIIELRDKKLSEISGGERTKVALAKVLLESPDILFLDEPTNFIDMESIKWLESYLNNTWTGGYVIISHDREFLDKTTNMTLEVHAGLSPELYYANYSGYLEERSRYEKSKLAAYKREQEYIEKQKALINRFRAGSRAGWAKSREKMLEKMDVLDQPYIPKRVHFSFHYSGESSERLLHFEDAFIGREEPLFHISEATMYKGNRIGIIGENGAGKSTFIKTILGKINLLDGVMSKGKNTQVLYYSQMHEELDPELSVRENFEKHGLRYSEQQYISILANMLLSREQVEAKVSSLSGGERSKVLFSILGQKESNLLIMDEPTNHLDYDTREALEDALQKYDGSILFISHDRYFINKLAGQIWYIDDGEMSISYGNYEDYTFKLENNIDMDMNVFDEEAELNLALEDKLGEKAYKRLKTKFGKGKTKDKLRRRRKK